MKFKSSVSELKKAFQILSVILNHNHQTLAYRYLLLRRKDERIEFKAYNDYALGSAFVNCYEIEEPDNSCAYILGKHIISLINSFAVNSEIQFEIVGDQCKIKCNKSKYVLPMLDAKVAKESLEALDQIDYYSKNFNLGALIKTDKFSAAYHSVSHCLSKDNSARVFQQVFLYEGKLIACDGIRGAVIDFEAPKLENIAFHKQACECILNVGCSEVALLLDHDKIYGKTDNYIFVVNREEDYPIGDIWGIVQKFDAKTLSFIFKINPDEINDKLNRVLMFADEDTNAVQIKFNEVELILSVENKSKAQEIVNMFENVNKKIFSFYVDGKNLREAFTKSLSDTKWLTNGGEEVQYIYDGNLLQFFLGLSV